MKHKHTATAATLLPGRPDWQTNGTSSPRRDFLRVMASAAASSLRSKAAPRDQRPNLIFLLTDDLRADCLGATGNRIIETPNIDQMAERGVTFVNTFCTTSICMSSRASIFTGLHLRSHGINSFDQPLKPADFANSYPVLLRSAGYRTGFIGKYGVGDVLPASSYDYFRGFPKQGEYFPQRDGKPIHLTTLVRDQAIEFIDGCRNGQPFCLSISFKAPHVQDEDPRQFLYDPALASLYRDVRIPRPKTAAKKYYQRAPDFIRNSEGHTRWKKLFASDQQFEEMVKGYYRLISGVDRAVGRIRDALAERGWTENTVLIFTSDNGFFLGERELSHKFLMYEESIRIPLIIYDPRLAPQQQGRRRPEMALNIDFAPTMLDLAGVPIPPAMQGRSLRPLLEGEHPNWRKDWFYEYLFTFQGKIPHSDGVRTDRWKYIRYPDVHPMYEELYDLKADPHEERNLAGDPNHSARLKSLRARREVWSTALDRWARNRPWLDP